MMDDGCEAAVEGIRRTDMYGNQIYLLGETGYGVSVAFGRQLDKPVTPIFTIFHISDGFRQSLYSTGFHDDPRTITVGPMLKGWASVSNVFHDRIAELLESRPHG